MPTMTPTPSPDPLQGLNAFAAKLLGPTSVALLEDPATLALLQARLRAGVVAEDALLGLVHQRARDDRALAEEFLQFFFEDLQRLGHGRMAVGLRRFVETGDLVQSVVGDLWPRLFDLEFRGRDAFLALLAARVRGKAADRARAMKSGRRREDRRVGGGDEAGVDWEGSTDSPGPMTELVAREEYEAMALALNRLPERERRLLRAHLAGQDWASIAAAEGLQPESARKAVQRAVRRAREWWRRRQEEEG
jgi:RNA polymerase sigma factor (sigma-70 family)